MSLRIRPTRALDAALREQLSASAGVDFCWLEAGPTLPGEIALDPDFALPPRWLARFAQAIAQAPARSSVRALSHADALASGLAPTQSEAFDAQLAWLAADQLWAGIESPSGLMWRGEAYQASDPCLSFAGLCLESMHRRTDQGQVFAELSALAVRIARWPSGYRPPSRAQAVILHVMHDWGGGAARWLSDVLAGDQTRTHLLLKNMRSGSTLGVTLVLCDARQPEVEFERAPLAPAIDMLCAQHAMWRDRAELWCRRYGVDQVVVSSLIGHSAEVFELGLPLLWICHDYFPLWPHLHEAFDHPQRRFDFDELRSSKRASHGPFQPIAAETFWAIRQRVISGLKGVPMIAPSANTKQHWQRLAPELADNPWQVIEHGLAAMPTIRRDPASAGRKLRILVPGRISGGKGVELLKAALPALSQHAELFLLGAGSAGIELMGQDHVHIISDYHIAELPELVRVIAPDAALLPRTVAETFSYSLSECWQLKLPVLATAVGSLAERIEHGVTGLLCAPTPEALITLISELAKRPELLASLKPGGVRTLAEMQADYARYWPDQGLERGLDQDRDQKHLVSRNSALEHAWAKSSSELAQAELALQQLRAQLKSQQLELEKRGDWGHEQAKLADQRTRWATSLGAQLETERVEAARERDRLLAACAQLDATVLGKQQQIELLESEQQRLQAIERELQALHQSSSWRLTAPLRATVIFLRARKQALGYYLRTFRTLAARATRSVRTRGLWLTLVHALRRRRALPPVSDIHTEPMRAESTAFEAFALPPCPQPKVSIVIPIYNKWAYTEACLRALARVQEPTPFEVLVIDDGSSDESWQRLQQIEGVRAYRNAQNLGFIGACNRGLELASGEFVFFLNNDTQVQDGFLEHLIEVFETRSDAGLVGSKLIYPDGRMQECGGIVFDDGSGWNYGRFEDPEDCRFKFLREVDYVSGAAILLPKTLLDKLGGFDRHYSPAYYEDTDLAFRVRARGLRVFVQPKSRVVHFEGISSGTDVTQGIKRFQVVNQAKFLDRWSEVLKAHPKPAPVSNIEVARQWRVRKRVLVIDACTPMPDQDSGSMRMFECLRILVDAGCAVSFFAENRAYHKGYAEALAAIGVEVLYHPYLDDVQRFLKAEGARFELCILSRYYVAERFLPLLRSYASKAKIWFDTVDLHFLRELREAELLSDAIRLRAAEQTKRAELALMRASDLTLVVSPVERNLLREMLPTVPVEILSNIHAVPGRRAEFAARRDLFFVGGFQHPPNTDAVLWFVREIWPLVAPHLAEAKLHIIGSKTPDEVTALASERVLIHGFVHDLEPMLDGARLSIAPLRYGAGVKGKINLSMSYGCPVVATAMAVEGMFLKPEHEVLVADTPELFAQQVVRLYQDEALWLKLSDASVANVEQHFSIRHARATLEHLLKQWC